MRSVLGQAQDKISAHATSDTGNCAGSNCHTGR